MFLPLRFLHDWSPFRLDALGLVTLLGAEEVSTAVGSLEHSYYTEYLPLFGTYLIAGNKFTRPISGYSLYNISDGVKVPIVNGWFSRWLNSHAKSQITILNWSVLDQDRSYVRKEVSACIIGLLTNGGLIALCALQGDFYGLANAVAMTISVAVRWRMVHENRHNLDKIVANFLHPLKPTPFLQDSPANLVKIVITLPEDKIVAFRIQRGLLSAMLRDLDTQEQQNIDLERAESANQATVARVGTDLTFHDTLPRHPTIDSDSSLLDLIRIDDNGGKEGMPDYIEVPQPTAGAPPATSRSTTSSSLANQSAKSTEIIQSSRAAPRHSHSYTIARAFGWIAFAVHVIAIGSATLPTQILSIAVLISSTMLAIYHVGNDVADVGRRLCISEELLGFTKHKDACRWLDPTEEEVKIMLKYDLLPYRSEDGGAVNHWNESWWKRWDNGR